MLGHEGKSIAGVGHVSSRCESVVIHIIKHFILESGFDLLESISSISWVRKVVMKANEVSNWHFTNVPKWNKWNNRVTVSSNVGFVAAIVKLAINACLENLCIMDNLFQGSGTFGSVILNSGAIFVIPRSVEVQ